MILVNSLSHRLEVIICSVSTAYLNNHVTFPFEVCFVPLFRSFSRIMVDLQVVVCTLHAVLLVCNDAAPLGYGESQAQRARAPASMLTFGLLAIGLLCIQGPRDAAALLPKVAHSHL